MYLSVKSKDKLKKGLNIVLGTGALCLGALLVLLMVNSWVSQYGMEQAFVFKNMADYGFTDSEYSALALTVLLFLLFILTTVLLENISKLSYPNVESGGGSSTPSYTYSYIKDGGSPISNGKDATKSFEL